MPLPSISDWSMYAASYEAKKSYDIAVKKGKVGYKYMINPNFTASGRFAGSYSLMVFIGNNNKPSEVDNTLYGYNRLGNHKTPVIACKKAKEHFDSI